MAKITLVGVDIPTDPHIQMQAFKLPVTDDKISFDRTTTHEVYAPHLIKFVSLTGRVLEFRGVDLQNSTQEFGPDGTAQTTYQLDLGDTEHGYALLPSTLKNLSANTPYAVLFLSDAYVDKVDTSESLMRALGGPKWPVSAEAIARLRAENAGLRTKNEELRSKVLTYLNDPALDSAHKSKLTNLFAGDL